MSIKTRTLNKDIINSCLKDMGKLIKRKMKKAEYVELVIVGGTSVLLNYNFRNSTTDIDCIDSSDLLMNNLINAIKEKYNLEIDWINTDFIKSNSYSKRLIEISKFYKSYGNGRLNIRTVKDEYLIAMKIVSGRKYKNDYPDIYGIIDDMVKRNVPISKEIIDNAIIYLYGSLNPIDKDAYDFAISNLNNKIKNKYKEVNKIDKTKKLS